MTAPDPLFAQGGRTVIVALCASLADRQLIGRGLAGYDIVWCARANEVQPSLRASAATLLVTRMRDGYGELVDEILAEVRALAPRITVVVIARSGEADRRDWAALSGMCAAELCEADDPMLPRLLCEFAVRAAIAERCANLAAQASAAIHPQMRRVVRNAMQLGGARISVQGFAASLGTPRSTLDRRLRSRLNMTSRRLLTWGRLLGAIVRSESSVVTGERLALDLGFGSASALANQFRTVLGTSRRDVVARGGSEYVLKRFLELTKAVTP